MKLPLYMAASALAIFATTSCSKDKITPNGQTTPSPSTMQYGTNVVVYDTDREHHITYRVQSNDTDVLSSVTHEIASSTLHLEFDGGSGTTSTGVILDVASAYNNAVIVTEVEHNIGEATGYTIEKGH